MINEMEELSNVMRNENFIDKVEALSSTDKAKELKNKIKNYLNINVQIQ
jgi:hypothetical protein